RRVARRCSVSPRARSDRLRPMLPARRPAPLDSDEWLYEPAYAGVRVIVDVTPGAGPGHVRIRAAGGRDVTATHPAVVEALATLTRRLKAPVRLDGELV